MSILSFYFFLFSIFYIIWRRRVPPNVVLGEEPIDRMIIWHLIWDAKDMQDRGIRNSITCSKGWECWLDLWLWLLLWC